MKDYEFNIIDTFVSSNYKFPNVTIDVEKYNKEVDFMLSRITKKKAELCKLSQSVRLLERKLFKKLEQLGD